MQKAQNTTIVVLLMAAAILTTLLVSGWIYTQQPAYAGSNCRAGDYIMASGMYDDSTDFIYVLDIAKEQLNLYYPDINTNQLTLGTKVNLKPVFGP